MKNNRKRLINISQKTFIQVIILLAALMATAIILTYIVPRGEFSTLADGSPDYLKYIRRDDLSGLPLIQGIFAPVLVFFSEDGLTLLMLSLFLMVISAAFQTMNDAGGIRSLIGAVSERFKNKRNLLLVLISFLFYSFGSFLGLFEEMLTMFPIVASLCVLIGLDSFTGFICTILSCGFGFASAVTNPFTVLLASGIIGVNPMTHIWFRIVIFICMFPLLMAFLFLYLRHLEKDPSSSLTKKHDEAIRLSAEEPVSTENDTLISQNRVRTVYSVFLLGALALIIISSMLEATRSYSVVFLIAYFLIFGILAGVWCTSSWKTVLKSFWSGLKGALPTIVFIGLSASIKYVFDEGSVMPTIANQINLLAKGKNIFLIALIVYAVVLVLEFFISSSTAKAILVMGLLSTVSLGLTDQMSVLLYTFADGYTNVLFPTSPVLLISLSMIEMEYFKWVKKSIPLFALNLLLVILFIILGVVIGY